MLDTDYRSLARGAALLLLVLLLSACQGESQVPTAPTVVPEVPAGQQATPSLTQPVTQTQGGVDLPGGARQGDQPMQQAKSDAAVSQPVISKIQRSGNNLQVTWSVASTTDIQDYRVQWILGNFTFNSPIRRRAQGVGGSVDTSSSPLTFSPNYPGGNLGAPWKVRVRARKASGTATHRRGGPWSAEVRIRENVNAEPPPACVVGTSVSPYNTCLAANDRVFHVFANGSVAYESRDGNEIAHTVGDTLNASGFSATRNGTSHSWTVQTLPSG